MIYEDEHNKIVAKMATRIEALEKELTATMAQLAHKPHFACLNIAKLNRDRFLASGVVITFTSLKGEILAGPVSFSDGLSDKTIEALQEDLVYTFDQRVELKPAVAPFTPRKKV